MNSKQLAQTRAAIAEGYLSVRKSVQAEGQSTKTSAKQLSASQRQIDLVGLLRTHIDEVAAPKVAAIEKEYVDASAALPNSPLNELDDEITKFIEIIKRRRGAWSELRSLSRDAGRTPSPPPVVYVAGGYLSASEAGEPHHVRAAVLGFGHSDGIGSGQRRSVGPTA